MLLMFLVFKFAVYWHSIHSTLNVHVRGCTCELLLCILLWHCFSTMQGYKKINRYVCVPPFWLTECTPTWANSGNCSRSESKPGDGPDIHIVLICSALCYFWLALLSLVHWMPVVGLNAQGVCRSGEQLLVLFHVKAIQFVCSGTAPRCEHNRMIRNW